MLQYFPTPYPDETWYSVLCRYHVRTGNPTPTATMMELFYGKDQANISSLCISNTIYDVLSKLPEGVLSYDEIVIKHTLFKYTTRFIPLNEKMDFLESVKIGKVRFPVKICKDAQKVTELKFCPICKQEDIKKFGEPFWHLCHQIPLANICQKHKCRLIKYGSTQYKRLNRKFVLPDSCQEDIIDYNTLPYEKFLTETVVKYQYMPMKVCPTIEYNNLYTGIFNSGYGIVRKCKEYMFNLNKISKDLCGLYGDEMVANYFLDTKLNSHILNYIRLWRFKSPERYVLISTLIGQCAETTFSKVQLKNDLYEKFIKLSKTSSCRSMIYIANELNVKPEHLNFLAYNLNIKPFWRENKNGNIKKVSMPIMITADERSQIREYAKTHGFVFSSTFVLYCVHRVINESLCENENLE